MVVTPETTGFDYLTMVSEGGGRQKFSEAAKLTKLGHCDSRRLLSVEVSAGSVIGRAHVLTVCRPHLLPIQTDLHSLPRRIREIALCYFSC